MVRAVRLSHERVGQIITSIRAHGSEQCRSCALYLTSCPESVVLSAIDVLMPFHSTTTTDSVQSINRGLAESPSEVLNPPCSSLKAEGSRVQSCRCVSRPLPKSHRPRQDAREHITRFSEYKTACRAPIRTRTELYGSAMSVWVKVSPQSELMGPSSAGFALAPDILLRTASPDRCSN